MTREAEEKTLAGKLHPTLLATVTEFIATAEPVGSNQVASHHRLGVKSAMVRNMMSELEEIGYLYQPHASAGRMPTEKAFRYYVDHLARPARIGFEERAQIELHYSAGDRDLDAITRDTPRLLALLTGQAALVTAPRLESVELERVNFVRLRERQVLAVFITRAGAIIKHVLATSRDAAQNELDRMADYLNQKLKGHTLEHARRWIEAELRQGRARYEELARDALALGEALAERAAQAELYVEGSAKVLEQPEFADRTRTRELLRALEDKTALLDLLERSLEEQGLMVSIGSENYDPRLAGLAVVAARYVGDSKPLGSLAVVGPMRMDYGRVIPLVEYTARVLSRVLEH
jgi:heat-inducible transcriptional repressor